MSAAAVPGPHGFTLLHCAKQGGAGAQPVYDWLRAKGVHVIGDACVAGAMPKSGYSANSEAKVCATNIVALMNGRELTEMSGINTCYSYITDKEAVSVAAVYAVKDNAIIAKISGRIEFVRDYKAKRKIAIIPEEGDPVEYLIPKSKVIDVQEGDWVKKGDNLISGSPVFHTLPRTSVTQLRSICR